MKESQPETVLVVSGGAGAELLRKALARRDRPSWTILEAADVEQARFLLQHDACDAVLIDLGGCGGGDVPGLLRLAAHRDAPVVVLTIAGAEGPPGAAFVGLFQRLPRELALDCPDVLHEALAAALRERGLRRQARRTAAELRRRRRQVAALLAMLWEVAPEGGPVHWFTQRSMLERLEEEVVRARRYRTPISVAVGGMPVRRAEAGPALHQPTARSWIASRIVTGRRRLDVAGQYGPHGFMLIMPNTPTDGAAVCCRRLQDFMDQPPAIAAEAPRVSAGLTCFGVAGSQGEVVSPAALLARAEECLQQAEEEGPGRVVCA